MSLRVVWNVILVALFFAAVLAVTIGVVIGLGGHVNARDLWDFIRGSVFIVVGSSVFALAVFAMIVLLHLLVGGPKVPVTSLGAFFEWWEKTGRLQFALGVIATLIVAWWHYRRILGAEVITACLAATVLVYINRRGIGV